MYTSVCSSSSSGGGGGSSSSSTSSSSSLIQPVTYGFSTRRHCHEQ
jgi:hypothetical protein